jgi:hypothetical protein
MKDKGMSIMIGLLGKEPKMAEKKEGGLLESDMESCPLSTVDADINKGNMKKAVLTADYGDRKDGEGKCKACEYYETGEEMTKCGVPKGMGHCSIFDFVCKGERGCQAWQSVESEEMGDESEEYED